MSSDANYKDTSFAIALHKLRGVQRVLKSKYGKDRRIKLLFVEEDAAVFEELKSYVDKITDFQATAIHGRFEDNILDVCEFIGRDLSFTFVDPKGWSGANPSVLEPILRLEGEVLINFMYDFVNRFLRDEREGVQRSLGALFPDVDAEGEVQSLEKLGLSREDAILELYKRSILSKSGTGSPSLVTSLAVKNRRAERTHFHLVYRTRNWKGIQQFRAAERQTLGAQDVARKSSKLASKRRTSADQTEMFGDAPVLADQAAIERERKPRLVQGRSRLDEILQSSPTVPYTQIVASVLSIPLVYEGDLKDWLQALHKEGRIRIKGLKGKSTRPSENSVIVTSPH